MVTLARHLFDLLLGAAGDLCHKAGGLRQCLGGLADGQPAVLATVTERRRGRSQVPSLRDLGPTDVQLTQGPDVRRSHVLGSQFRRKVALGTFSLAALAAPSGGRALSLAGAMT